MNGTEKKKVRRAEIVHTLSAEFAAQPSGARLASTAELQRRFGCAPMTIVRALDELELRGEIVRIQGKGTFAPCRELREVFILSPAPNGLWPREGNFLSRTIDGASRMGITAHVIYTTASNRPDDVEMHSLNRIPEHGAVLVSGYWYHHAFEFLRERHCRVVYFNSSWDLGTLNDGPTIAGWYQLVMPVRSAMLEAVRRLHARGRKRIFFLHSCVHCETMHILAYREALARHGIRHDPALELFCYEDFQSLYETLDMRFQEVRDFDAVLTCRAEQAEAALMVLRKLRRAVPRDCSVVCLREQPRLAACEVPVTCVDSDPDTAGIAALELLASGLPMPQVRTLDYVVHERCSI